MYAYPASLGSDLGFFQCQHPSRSSTATDWMYAPFEILIGVRRFGDSRIVWPSGILRAYPNELEAWLGGLSPS